MNLANLPSTTSSNSRASGGGGGGGRGNEEAGEKRTRFSLSQEEGSIGNTSDNLEAISEAASNHSVDSSLDEDEVDQEGDELDDANIIDNLSDMVSANVSGRGTPNVSGRDTPSSQVRCLGKLSLGLPYMMSAKFSDLTPPVTVTNQLILSLSSAFLGPPLPPPTADVIY